MKLLVPSWRELNEVDARLIRLTEFLGGKIQILPLQHGITLTEAFLEEQVADKTSCMVLNPEVLRRLFPQESFPADLASYLVSTFPFLLVYNLRPDAFSASTLKAFSYGRLQSVCPVEAHNDNYTVAEGNEAGGCFSGLTCGPANPAHDQVLSKSTDGDIRTLISLDKRPLLASTHEKRAEVFFIATASLADLNAAWDGKPLIQYFSRLVPAAMAVRSIFREECWLPNQSHGCLIIDDPMLREDYGFLNYEEVLKSMDEYNFHTSIAFIPHNSRRNSPGISRMFRKRRDRYSICFHGNDHTEAEFATQDANLLNSMLRVAETRMEAYHRTAGIECDKVMVFPQGNFSSTAMKVLRARNFHSAVNTGAFPQGEDVTLTLAEVLQPAVLKYGGFPLFLRKYVRKIAPQDVAFDLFFGKPIFVVEHHNIFRDLGQLTELVTRINALAPKIQWSSVRAAVESSWLSRRAEDGKIQVRVYSKTSRIRNDSQVPRQYEVEWPERGEPDIEKVTVDGARSEHAWSDDGSVRFPLALAPGESRLVSVIHENKLGESNAHTRFGWTAKAYMRRRLSEIRDNYLSKSPHILSLAKYVQKRLLSGTGASAERAE